MDKPLADTPKPEEDCEQAKKLCESDLLLDVLDDKVKIEELRKGGY